MTHQSGSKDPLHGIKLQTILEELVDIYGWDELAKEIRINCFAVDPSIKSSLTFLRRTNWARDKVEKLYVATKERSAARTKQLRESIVDNSTEQKES